MEHSYIEEQNIDSRYLFGDLSLEERMRFEEHFIDCRYCLDRLKAVEGLRAGLRTVAAEAASRSRAYAQVGLLARIARLRRTTLLAGVALLVALPAAFLSWQWSIARRDLARSEQTSSEWRRKYAEREQAARNLATEIQESSAQRCAHLRIECHERRRAGFFSAGRSDHDSSILEIYYSLARTRV
jgi:hypothetical protein